MAVCTYPPRVFASSQPGARPRLSGRVDPTASVYRLSSPILRFPPNFVRQLSTKARRNCSNIGVAQIVAASWSNNTPNSGVPAAPSATAVDAAATSAIPVDPAQISGGDEVAVFGNGVQLGEALPDLKEASFLSSDGSLAIHAGERLGRGIVTDAITTPVVNTSAYFFKKTADLIDFKEKRATSFEYGRYGNPTTVVVEEKISALEGAESTMILASGMCASTVMLMALVPAGGHIVTTTDCYRKTRIFIETILPKMGITATIIDPADMGATPIQRDLPVSCLLPPTNTPNPKDFHLLVSMAPVAAEACSDSIKPRDVYIVGVARTPMGGFLGALSSVPATKLGSIAIGAALKRANVDPALVEEVFFGNVLSANLGQAPARQAALGAGLPNSVICTTVNKVCASGLKATMLAAQSIQLGINDVVVAGGMESMSNVPKYFAEARKGSRLGHDSLVDGMLKDGLWDVYNDYGMGVCAELCAEQHSVTREEQDNFAVQSFERGIAAQGCDAFSWEIVPVEVSGGRGRPSTIVDKDEGLGKFDAAKLRKLRPSFKESGGSVTAGNASSISDGAAALVLASGEKVLKLGLQVIAKISGFADAAQAPELFTTAPALAIPKAISNAGLEASQIDFYEINEAFAVVALANQKLLGLNPEKVNVHGGAVALGHPLGCSGARILVTLLGVLKQKNGKYGAAGICNGGGGASALVLELL